LGKGYGGGPGKRMGSARKIGDQKTRGGGETNGAPENCFLLAVVRGGPAPDRKMGVFYTNRERGG